MIKFSCITGYDQMVIKGNKEEAYGTECNGDGKWAKQKRDLFHADIPKVHVTPRHIYAAHLNSLIILDTKPLTDSPTDRVSFGTNREFHIDKHSASITCFAVEENSLLICSCSDESVFLSKWDSLLGHWDSKCISEDDGRILSCSLTIKDFVTYITIFKSDILLIYKVVSAHEPQEPGPLILTGIECLTSLEKVKELTTWSKSLFFRDNLNIIGVAIGNTVAMKHWEVVTENSQILLKLKSHRMVSYLKTIAGADIYVNKETMFALIVGNDGVSELYSLNADVFNLLYRFKIEDALPSEILSPSTPAPINNNINNNNLVNVLQVESRILSAKFFPIKFSETPRKPKIYDLIERYHQAFKAKDIEGGTGDAKFSIEEFDKLSTDEKQAFLNNADIIDVDIGLEMCPKLIVAVATTKGIMMVDVVSGQHDVIITHADLLKDTSIFIQNAQMSIDIERKEVILALQSCLTRVVFSRRFQVEDEAIPTNGVQSQVSLIPRETLSSKSVLRKKIKSSPRNNTSHPVLKLGKPTGFPKGATPPSWARSRSRPQLKPSLSRTRITPPLSARSHTSVGSSNSQGFLSIENGDSVTTKIVHVPAVGSYENDDLPLHKCQSMVMSTSSISHGISALRITTSPSGKHLAFGGNITPLIVTKVKPFQHSRIFKDCCKITSVNFNFSGNLLLVASSDCRTTIVDWQNSKNLLSFDFSTKFNDHVHAQYYFMDKFIIQPEANKLAMYSYAKRENGYIKLKAGEFLMQGQSITAMGAANQFYSNMIITGLSNKSIQMFDTNAEAIALTIPNTHTKPISCIRINEAPTGSNATALCDIFLTSSFSNYDPIKLWDVRSAKCIMRISDINQSAFVPTARPNLSPCGRFIVSGLEDNVLSFYDVRKIKNRLHTIKKIGTTVLDCCFDGTLPMVWSGCRNGSIVNFYIP